MILREELIAESRKLGVPDRVVEKDYFLGLILKGLATHKPFRSISVFKGGTALRKCYFQDYRFSEDLDFTILENNVEKDSFFHSVLKLVTKEVNQEFGVSFDLFGIEQIRDVEGEEAYKAKLHYSGMSGKGAVSLDFTFYEKVELKPKTGSIHHPYSDSFKATIPVYQLEEIAAEKLRSILNVRTYHRGRDVYDLWYLCKYGKLNLKTVRTVFEKKCALKKSDKKDLSLLNTTYLQRFKSAYEIQLQNQLKNLPDYLKLVQELSNFLKTPITLS